MEDIDKVIADNMGLLYAQLHRFNRAYDDDAFSYGLEALWKAAETYDKNKKVTFSTYASVCIYNAIAWYLREGARQKKSQPVSFEDPVYEDSDMTVIDTVSSNETPETVCLQNELYDILWKNFDKVLQSFTNSMAIDILNAWRDSDFLASQTELSRMLGVSQSHVSRTLSAFKHKLKLEMEEYL